MGAGYADIDMEKIGKEVSEEMIGYIIDEESIEYNKLEEEKKRLFDEEDHIFSKIKEIRRGRLIGLSKEEDERLTEVHCQLLVIGDKQVKVQLVAYQEIKERWNREIREKKV
jgi:hypothetical protein